MLRPFDPRVRRVDTPPSGPRLAIARPSLDAAPAVDLDARRASEAELEFEPGICGSSGPSSLTVKRSGDKFLVPFEVPSPAPWMDFGMSVPRGTIGDLQIFLVEISKVK